jgi:glutamyl-Q tRNA(Asp) synthetase
MARVTRFAPSPTGPLHLGHAFAALTAAARGDRFLLRIEDIDRARCKAPWEQAIFDDLQWLGLRWETPALRQSDRLPLYDAAVRQLLDEGLAYACTCSRADIRTALSAPQGVDRVTDAQIYPGTCRHRGHPATAAAIRLDMAKAMQRLGQVEFLELGPGHEGRRVHGAELVQTVGDVVLARRDIGAAYHVAVVVDDAAQGVTEVTRGEDLVLATPIHVVLQRLLEFSTPTYYHHKLIRDESGKRLAKRDDARALSKYRAEGATPADIRRMVGL